MNEIEFETMLYELLQDDEAAPEIARVQTFEEAGLLTNNRGVVVHTADGVGPRWRQHPRAPPPLECHVCNGGISC